MNKKELLKFAYAAYASYMDGVGATQGLLKGVFPEYRSYSPIRFENHYGIFAEYANHQIVSFRGTDSNIHDLRDWKCNLDSNKGSIQIKWNPHKLKCHHGFMMAGRTFYQKLHWIDKNKKTYIASHSLGAGISNIFTAMMIDENINLQGLITFGSPRVWNYTASKIFDRKIGHLHYRVINKNDPVPAVPLYLMNYRHSGKLIYINHKDELNLTSSLIGRMRDRLHCSHLPVENHHMPAYISALKGEK